MRFSFAPSIQEAGGLENALRAFCKQREAEKWRSITTIARFTAFLSAAYDHIWSSNIHLALLSSKSPSRSYCRAAELTRVR